MEDEPEGGGANDGANDAGTADSLLPYDEWTEAALRHAAANGLPGEHHFYISFRTDDPGTSIPARLKAQYPQEMTIVLQHQFWDLSVDEEAVSVGLSFGGVPATLRIPVGAITGFSDPHVRFGLRFRPVPSTAPPPEPAPDAQPEPAGEPGAVVSLDAFRRRPQPKT